MVDRVPFAVSRFGTTFSRGSRQLAFPRDQQRMLVFHR